MKDIKKLMMTLVALLAVTTGAWAQEETLLTTITLGGELWSLQPVYTESGRATLETSGTVETGWVVPEINGWQNSSPDEIGSVTITAAEGYEITKVVFWNYEFMVGYNDALTDNASPFTCYLKSSHRSLNENMSSDSYGNIAKIEVYGTAAPSASTVEVAWTAASKTGTFKMPGGNVELEPEYYPQAALTAQPTAINDVPATTDGAIVKAGTVKNIGETTTAQGTVMYYVSPTALDDAALLALAADAWTADVPTAESLAQGQAYVYYYVRGNDSDTDEENFSDGDILAANALTVTIAAAPTYAVTFADDLAEPTLWTASPNADVKKGQTVTVTYTGTKKVLGVKAEKKAAGPVTYTELKGGEVLHVGDKIQIPESDKYWYPGAEALDYEHTYEVVRVNISGDEFMPTVTESETGAYYALHVVGTNNYKFVTVLDSDRLKVTATSDGIAVADNGTTATGYHKYIFSVHEP